MKACLACKHFVMDPGSPGYSSWTPGMPGDISCAKQHWSMSSYGMEPARDFVEWPAKCGDYEISEVAIAAGWTP